jgi:hypothetical protein
MTAMPVIDELFMEHLGASLSKQMTLLRATAGLRCEIDMEGGKAAFGDRYTFPVQLLGFEGRDGTWTWGWALEEIPEPLREAVRQLEAYGEEHDLDIFHVPSFKTDDLGGDELAILACGIMGSAAFFVADMVESVGYFLVPDLGGQLPADRPAAFVAEVIAEMLGTYELQKPAPALRDYLLYEGYDIDKSNPKQWTARHPNGSRITLAFDPRGRLKKLDAKAA